MVQISRDVRFGHFDIGKPKKLPSHGTTYRKSDAEILYVNIKLSNPTNIKEMNQKKSMVISAGIIPKK